MFNSKLSDQFNELKQEGLIKVKYPAGYKKWKAKFDYWFNITKDVNQTFDIMYGPGGGVKHYRGGLTCNANIKLPTNSAKGRKKK